MEPAPMVFAIPIVLLLILISGTLYFLASKALKIRKKADQVEDASDEFRLELIASKISSLENILSRYKLIAILVICMQYILGAALTSSFMEKEFDARVLGVLGLLVVIASAINQQLKPGEKATMINTTVLKLNHLLRWAEDQVLRISESADGAPSKYALRDEIRDKIYDIELMG